MLLKSGKEETNITDYFIESAFPSQDEVDAAVIGALEGALVGSSVLQLLAQLNISRLHRKDDRTSFP